MFGSNPAKQSGRNTALFVLISYAAHVVIANEVKQSKVIYLNPKVFFADVFENIIKCFECNNHVVESVYSPLRRYSKEIEVNTELPTQFSLSQNYPNPFNPNTVIRYQLPLNSVVTLKVFDDLGKEVATLVNETKEAGNYEVTFDASKLSSGVYIYKLSVGKLMGIKKMMIVK